jgi:hypothetical protein
MVEEVGRRPLTAEIRDLLGLFTRYLGWTKRHWKMFLSEHIAFFLSCQYLSTGAQQPSSTHCYCTEKDKK